MSKVAIIIGGAQGVWEDLIAALRLVRGRDYLVVATNDAGYLYEGDIDAWATLHPEKLTAWREAREEGGANTDYRSFVHADRRALTDVEIVPHGWYGSSGLYAAQVALQTLGCVGAILCGVPMDPERGRIAKAGDWTEFELFRPGVFAAQAEEAPIRSMSGWTAETLGKPTKAWLDQIGVTKAGRIKRHRKEEQTMRIQMLRTRNFTPRDDRRVTLKYEAEKEYTVRREWGDELVADADAVEIDAPAKDGDADAR